MPQFWLLAATFFVCGYTSNGMVLTHFMPHALEHNFSELQASAAAQCRQVLPPGAQVAIVADALARLEFKYPSARVGRGIGQGAGIAADPGEQLAAVNR